MKDFKQCPNGHSYKEDLEQCPYCSIDKQLEEIGKKPPIPFRPPKLPAMCYRPVAYRNRLRYILGIVVGLGLIAGLIIFLLK